MAQLRINLLPAYIAERKKRIAAIAGASGLFAAVLAGSLFMWFTAKTAADNRETEADEQETLANAVTATKAETARIRSAIQPLQDKVDYVEAARFYNGWRQKIFRRAAQYTYNNVEYNSMSVTGNTLTMNGYATSVGDVGRYYITMFGNPDITALSISGVPGWDPNKTAPGAPPQPTSLVAKAFPLAVTATLKGSVAPPTLPASLTAAPTAGGAPAAAAPTASPDAPPPDAAPGASSVRPTVSP